MVLITRYVLTYTRRNTLKDCHIMATRKNSAATVSLVSALDAASSAVLDKVMKDAAASEANASPEPAAKPVRKRAPRKVAANIAATKPATAKKVAARKVRVTAAALKKVSAKVKKPSKADIERADKLKVLHRAKVKAGKSVDVTPLVHRLVDTHLTALEAQNVMAAWMNITFSETMSAFKCHWSSFTDQNCRSENEKAVLEQVRDIEKQVQELLHAKSPSARKDAWKRMADASYEQHFGEKRRNKNTDALDVAQKKLLISLYKKTQGEERPTENELDIGDAVGKLLSKYFKVDLTKYNK